MDGEVKTSTDYQYPLPPLNTLHRCPGYSDMIAAVLGDAMYTKLGGDHRGRWQKPARSSDRNVGLAGLHLVSTWVTANEVMLRQVAYEVNSNEITRIPKLLGTVRLQRRIITMGCQTKIDGKVESYVFALYV